MLETFLLIPIPALTVSAAIPEGPYPITTQITACPASVAAAYNTAIPLLCGQFPVIE